MTVSTLRPATAPTNTGAVTGAANAALALSDDSDSSYVTFEENERAELTLTDLTLPADAVIKSVGLRFRLLRSGFTPVYTDCFLRYTDAVSVRTLQGATKLNWTTPTTVTFVKASSFSIALGSVGEGFDLLPDDDFTDTRLDGATLGVSCRAVQNLTSDVRVHEAYVDVTYVEQPVVGVGQPTGTVTEESAPTVFWFQDLDVAEPVSSHFEAKIFTDDQVSEGGFDPDTTATFFNSGVVEAAATTVGAWNIGDTGLGLPDGDYHSYVRVAVTVNGELLWSDWDSEPFEMLVDRPGQPSLLVTPDAANGRITLTLDSNAGDVNTDYFEVERSDDGETTWVKLRTGLGNGLIEDPGAVAVTLDDYEAPNGSEVTYRARARHNFDPGVSFSEWTDAIGLWSSDSWWLKHPTTPGYNVEVDGSDSAWMSYPGHNRTARQGVFQAMGSAHAVVVKDKRSPRAGQVVIRLDEDAKKTELDTLLETESPVFIQGPVSQHEPDRWVAIGDNERSRLIDKGWMEPTLETLNWIEVQRPELAGAAGVTTFPEPPPEPIEGVIDFDSFEDGVSGTGTLAWTHTPVNDGEITGIIVGIVQDDSGVANDDQITAVTVEGEPLEELGAGGDPTGDGRAYLYFLGAAIPSGPLDISVTVSGATNKRGCSWLVYGVGDTAPDDVLVASAANSLTFSDSVTATAEAIVVGCAYMTPNVVTSIDVGINYTNDQEIDFGVNTGIWFHRTDDAAAGTVAVNLTSTEATCDYGVVALAIRVGIAIPPGGPTVVREDLATMEDPTGATQATFLWRKVDSAYAAFSGDFNWTAADLQHVRLTASPDPHHPVGAADSTHYRRVILSEAYLAGNLTGSPTTLAITAVSQFPVPPNGICSIEGLRAFTYTGRTGSFPNYTLTGISWIDATPNFTAGEAVRFQSTYDAGVPNDSYRAQMQRWSSSASNTFYAFQPGTRRQIVWSVRMSTADLPWPAPTSPSRRSMVMQFKPSPSGGTGPILSMRQYGDVDTLEIRHDVTGVSTALIDEFDYDPTVGWLRFMMDITFAPTAATGRFQLFGDLEGDRLDFEDMVPLSEQMAVQTCFAPADPQGEVSGIGFGPYCQMLVPAHYRDYANIQVIDPT